MDRTERWWTETLATQSTSAHLRDHSRAASPGSAGHEDTRGDQWGGGGVLCQYLIFNLETAGAPGDPEGRGGTVSTQQAVTQGAVWALPVPGQDGGMENAVAELDGRAGVNSTSCKLDLNKVAVSFFF